MLVESFGFEMPAIAKPRNVSGHFNELHIDKKTK